MQYDFGGEINLTQDFADMMYLFSCGALGVEPKLSHKLNFDSVYRQALIQGVWHTVYLPLTQLYEKGIINIENDAFMDKSRVAMMAIVNNIQRTSLIHEILRTLKNKDIPYCLLKGEILSCLYHEPNCRISSDTDIFLNKEYTDKFCSVLKGFGFVVKPSTSEIHPIRAIHPVAGIIEVHTSLYNKKLFSDTNILKKEEYRKIKTVDNEEITTLGITDGLIFITLHCIRHFLYTGCGIRQIMDILLYAKTYNNQIDWERFNNIIVQIKSKKFINNIFGIGTNYLCFKEEDLPIHDSMPSIMLQILSDIESGGLFGGNDKKRTSHHFEYAKSIINKSNNKDYDSKKWIITTFRRIFPDIRTLSLYCPYIQKMPLLYPFALFQKNFSVLIKLLKKERNIGMYNNYNDIKKRMDLIRDLEMI